jgi:hypothetical protein
MQVRPYLVLRTKNGAGDAPYVFYLLEPIAKPVLDWKYILSKNEKLGTGV